MGVKAAQGWNRKGVESGWIGYGMETDGWGRVGVGSRGVEWGGARYSEMRYRAARYGAVQNICCGKVSGCVLVIQVTLVTP